MKKQLTLPLLLLAGLVAPHAAVAEDGYSGTNMKFLYTAEVIGKTDPLVREQLALLRKSGINVIPVSGTDSDLAAVRQDPLLSQFKVVLMYNGPIYDAWSGGEAAACTPGSERLPSTLESKLDELASVALQNADIVVGYYTFDEPALPKLSVNRGICKRYQELVYQRIRQADPDKVARPVIIANTMWNLDDAQIQYGMSPGAQDVVFVDQYAYDLQSQINYYRKWQQHGLLHTGMVPVLPAFADTCRDPALRSSFRPTMESALQSVYGSDRPQNMGSAYFAYWPGNRPDFAFDGHNCPDILNSVVDDLTHQPDLQVMRVETVPAQFLPGQSVRFRAVIKNTGNATSPMGYHSVLVHENGRCFTGGCQWAIVSTSLSPGQEATIDLGQGPSWVPTAGLHTITAFVDDADRIKESNEGNNERTREILVGNKPDLKPYVIESVPQSFKPGDSVGFRVAVTNRGSMTAPVGWLGAVYTINGTCPQTGCPWSGLTTALAPGESIWLPAAGPTWPAVAGPQSINAIVDDSNQVAESDEGNNQLLRVIDVSDKPDLHIVEAYTQPARPRAGDATSFVATVENRSSVTAGASWVGLLATEGGQCFSQGCVWGGLQNMNLAPGTRAVLTTYSNAWRATPGLHVLELTVDDQNTLAESREDNNTHELKIQVD
ncbi:CARDB domain-containing protein [Stenotrophomonas sp. PD6]|uniref:CARDB domain-containing protein n=1 Tax=Stenotrophomonas sp. PD6 TaxID=3368612 RepID=UPI003B9F0EC9